MREPIGSKLQRVVLPPAQMSEAQRGTKIVLTDSQQHYLSRVLRLGSGDRFWALDGHGGWWLAELQAPPIAAILLENACVQAELPIALTLAIAMPKGTHLESVIRQATELGVTQIVPLWSDRTVIPIGTSVGAQKMERWQRLAREAAEQACRSHVPDITPVQSFREFAGNVIAPYRYIGVTHRDVPHLLSCLQAQPLNGSVAILTGPEGGWSPEEEQVAIASGFQPVTLGDRVLAAITAPVVALAILDAVIHVGLPNQP